MHRSKELHDPGSRSESANWRGKPGTEAGDRIGTMDLRAIRVGREPGMTCAVPGDAVMPRPVYYIGCQSSRRIRSSSDLFGT